MHYRAVADQAVVGRVCVEDRGIAQDDQLVLGAGQGDVEAATCRARLAGGRGRGFPWSARPGRGVGQGADERGSRGKRPPSPAGKGGRPMFLHLLGALSISSPRTGYMSIGLYSLQLLGLRPPRMI